MRVSVTGGDGLLGSNLVRKLAEAGHAVTVLLQKNRKTDTLEGVPAGKIYGDMLDIDILRDLCSRSEAVIHAAASVAVWPSRSEAVRTVNIEGTRKLIQAAEETQIDRFIYVGTANSFCPGTKEHPGDETTSFVCGKYKLDYIDSKYEAQQLVLRAHTGQGLPALTVNPTFMIGPYDAGPSSGALIAALCSRKIPGYTPGGKCWVHVGDVSDALTAALTQGRSGESYIAGGENLSYREFFSIASEVLGVKPPKLPLAKPLILIGAASAELYSRVMHTAPTVSYAMARIACDKHYYSSAKARKELHMPFTPIQQAVLDSFSWMKDHGMLKSSYC